jgi:hypothetical protein
MNKVKQTYMYEMPKRCTDFEIRENKDFIFHPDYTHRRRHYDSLKDSDSFISTVTKPPEKIERKQPFKVPYTLNSRRINKPIE